MEKLWKNPESDQLASSRQKRCCLHQRVLNSLVLIKVFIISWIMLILFSTEGTPFAGGVFKMKICLTKEFPASPPKGYFLTKIFHPNVSSAGEICVF